MTCAGTFYDVVSFFKPSKRAESNKAYLVHNRTSQDLAASLDPDSGLDNTTAFNDDIVFDLYLFAELESLDALLDALFVNELSCVDVDVWANLASCADGN